MLDQLRTTSGDEAIPEEPSSAIAATGDDQKGGSPDSSERILTSTVHSSTASAPAKNTNDREGANSRQPQQLASHSADPIRFMLPDASITEKAIDSLFSCSGSLFHIFKRNQIAEYSRTIFESQDLSRPNSAANICSVMAVAAVGAQYLPDVFSQEAIAVFYDLVKYLFDGVVEHEPLHAIKVCTLLAHYHVLDRATVAIAYVGESTPKYWPGLAQPLSYTEVGLAIARMYGFGGQPFQQQPMPTSARTDLQKTWRTLIFFSRCVFILRMMQPTQN